MARFLYPLSPALVLLALASSSFSKTTLAFTPISFKNSKLKTNLFLSSPATSESEAERLLRKARALAAEAAAEEQALHETLLEKKKSKDKEMDKCIDQLLPTGELATSEIVERLKKKKWSTDKLLCIVDRLHEREVIASGFEHVEHASHHEQTKFTRVAQPDEKELARVTGLIDKIVEAAEAIDEEYMEQKRTNKNLGHLSHVDMEHWTVGEVASTLKNKIREMRRGHDKQFQDRLESFYEAQRKKDLPPPKKFKP
mmetsp:Transcript_28852/g.44353  ORF Transcript_28852/g.44353 Transcript_28852/m.44353 type:complete len:256 (-) Transcript_28852:908-1675(-)